jgi:hypothetical protein
MLIGILVATALKVIAVTVFIGSYSPITLNQLYTSYEEKRS